MHLVHLTASTFFGGPERQMLGLAEHLPDHYKTTFLSFREGGRCNEFLEHVRGRGFDSLALQNDTPYLFAAVRELSALLLDREIDVLFCHGYKANLVGRFAARRAGIPIVGVSRGWTGESAKVRLYESIDRWHLKYLDRVVCVSNGQAEKVRRTGTADAKIQVIRNSARTEAFNGTSDRPSLRRYFSSTLNVSSIVLAAGRLSPEKGFAVLVESAAHVIRESLAVGFVLFGDGMERETLERRVRELGIADRFLLPGFIRNLDQVLPAADVVVLPSFTEGLPNVALEASAAGVPVVATAVGGTPEVVRDGLTGWLVAPGNPEQMAERIQRLLVDRSVRWQMGNAGREFMQSHFSFEAQAAAYVDLVEALRNARTPVAV